MAEAPALLHTFVTAFQQFHGSSFGGAERQTLLLNNAVSNGCEWAVAFHSALALGEGVSAEDVRAIREGNHRKTPKLAALSALTRALVEKRGHVRQSTTSGRFLPPDSRAPRCSRSSRASRSPPWPTMRATSRDRLSRSHSSGSAGPSADAYLGGH